MSNGPKLGFIGLGVMGEPIARNMLRAGLGAMAVFDLDPAPVARLGALGAQAAGSVAEVAPPEPNRLALIRETVAGQIAEVYPEFARSKLGYRGENN